MRKATLKPNPLYPPSDEGTFSILTTDTGFTCQILELPWRDNAKGKSCIPAGTYVFKWRTDSPKHGQCFEMVPDDEAPDRLNVQIHTANLAGDEDKGFVKQLEGCLAPGLCVVVFAANTKPAGPKAQRGVAGSHQALEMLLADLGREPFELTVIRA